MVCFLYPSLSESWKYVEVFGRAKLLLSRVFYRSQWLGRSLALPFSGPIQMRFFESLLFSAWDDHWVQPVQLEVLPVFGSVMRCSLKPFIVRALKGVCCLFTLAPIPQRSVV